MDKIQHYHTLLNHSLLIRERLRSSEDDHYLEFVEEVKGVCYVDDSKATSLHITQKSIDAIDAKIVLLIGGADGENDYSKLTSYVSKKIDGIIYMGNNVDSFLKHFSESSLFFAKAMNIQEAVKMAYITAHKGSVVLFSPSCSSTYNFDNYKLRGKEFKEAVKKLNEIV